MAAGRRPRTVQNCHPARRYRRVRLSAPLWRHVLDAFALWIARAASDVRATDHPRCQRQGRPARSRYYAGRLQFHAARTDPGTTPERWSGGTHAPHGHAGGRNGGRAPCGAAGGKRRTLERCEYDAFLANDRTLADPQVVTVEQGGRVLLRVINGSAMSNYHIDLGALDADLIAVDGCPVVPVRGRAFPITTAQRLDIKLTVPQSAA